MKEKFESGKQIKFDEIKQKVFEGRQDTEMKNEKLRTTSLFMDLLLLQKDSRKPIKITQNSQKMQQHKFDESKMF